MSDYLVPMGAGLGLGFGLSSVAYLHTFTKALKQLHNDNVETARLLQVHQTVGVQKVEEQNQDSLQKRLDEIQTELARRNAQ